jgi:IS1 family transposase
VSALMAQTAPSLSTLCQLQRFLARLFVFAHGHASADRKETGQTAHIERLNNTLRQRLSRLVRKTLSFSKRVYLLNLHFKLFAYFYNLERLTT